MSIWGPGPHENDDAADWLAELEEAPNLFALNEAFDIVLGLERDPYIEVTDGAVVVMAAAIVNMLCNGSGLTDFVGGRTRKQLVELWAELAPGARQSLARRAAGSLVAVLVPASSEIDELMSQSKAMYPQWLDRCTGLLQSLRRFTT